MTEDDPLQKLLGRIPSRPPDGDAASRIARRAAAMPQRRGLRLLIAAAGARLVSPLVSPWPDDLTAKAAMLGAVMILTFAAGIDQERARHHAPDILSYAYGDVDESEAL